MQSKTPMPTLTNEQLETYFTAEEEVPPWAESLLDSLLADENASILPRRVLDLGGGIGRHLDAILAAYPYVEGTLVDLSPYMLQNNLPHPRKELICGDITDLESVLPLDQSYDLITIWYTLHHCLGMSVRQTRQFQQTVLENIARLLSPRGRCVIVDVCYESYLVSKYASRMIYYITRSKLLAPIARRFGANTAGTGVLFATEKEMKKLFEDSGLVVEESIFLEDESKGGPLVQLALGIKSSYFKAWVLRRADV